MKRNIVVAVTGASGVAYALRLIEVLHAARCDVHLTISANAEPVFRHELNRAIDVDQFSPESLGLDCGPRLCDEKLQRVRDLAPPDDEPARIFYHHYRDFMAPIASGSFLTDGMVVCPCSSGTLSAIVHGTTANLIHRAADVHLKERRRLVLVPRETPLSIVLLDNLKRAAEAGAVILPAMPGFYHGATAILDLVDFVVSRICDQFRVPNELIQRWGE
jgi:4-hydroxy-3-polyprenylbenzoate decarboxylase